MLNFILLIFIYMGIYAISALGQNLIVGYTGLLSLCQAAFLGIGAYATAVMMTAFNMGFWEAMLISGLITAICGMFIGIPTLRLKGDYLAIATLGFGEIVKNIIVNWDSVTKGPMGINGIPGPSLFGFMFSAMDKISWVILIWVIVGVTYYFVRRIVRSRIGRALEAIREDEIAASAMGINTAKYKIGAFTTGAFLAGLAGSLFASYNQSVAPLTFDFMMSVMILCMVVLGGLGNNFATVVGTFIIVITSELPRLLGISHIIPPQLNQVIFGLILVLMMIYRPQGIIGRVKLNYAKIVKEEILHLEK
ncbi:MAG TPA: branched-chain amino acid ABC transporter permease [Spirochaetota bacterium]|nr:branched-chain amino acid ABC transporter permease [Spirochaetota bacterium]HPJ36138.1 branched-chain amino acid ABC transporter permease [Spirochaetota bacterium]